LRFRDLDHHPLGEIRRGYDCAPRQHDDLLHMTIGHFRASDCYATARMTACCCIKLIEGVADEGVEDDGKSGTVEFPGRQHGRP
jgi:hypothetical protein